MKSFWLVKKYPYNPNCIIWTKVFLFPLIISSFSTWLSSSLPLLSTSSAWALYNKSQWIYVRYVRRIVRWTEPNYTELNCTADGTLKGGKTLFLLSYIFIFIQSNMSSFHKQLLCTTFLQHCYSWMWDPMMYIHVDNVVKVCSSKRGCFLCEGAGEERFTGWHGLMWARI